MSYGQLETYRPGGLPARDFSTIIQTCSTNIQRLAQCNVFKITVSDWLILCVLQLQHTANRLAKETNEFLKELGSLPLPLSTSEQRQQKLQKERLMNDFSAALNNFQAVQRRVSEKEKETVARARAGSRFSGDERRREEQLVSFDSNEEWDQMQAQEEDIAITEQDLELIKERETAIRQLEWMFFFSIDSIEANVENAEVHVENANEQLQRAAYYQKKSRKKICILIFGLALACLILVCQLPGVPCAQLNGGSHKMAANANSAGGGGGSLPLFDCPTWAGKPPPGLHLDVVKGDKLIEKLIIDEKKYYLFGRNPDLCDFTIDHQSCSRVHAALVYHKHLKRVFLIDLNSTHGTFLGHIRLEPHKPQQIPIDSTVSFGASTRAYTLREKPQTLPSAVKGDEKMTSEDDELKGLLGLPEEETELDNLTEFNTAHNKRISTLTIEEGNLDIQRPKRKRKNSRVTFSDDDEIINPEDVDPSVGRFRNMVQTAVVPVKKKRMDNSGSLAVDEAATRRMQNFPYSGGLYGGLPPTHNEAGAQTHTIHGTALIGGLPMPYPNLAPDVDLTPVAPSTVAMNPAPNPAVFNPEVVNEPKKKKYAKEAWPGKKPTPSLLI
ncbi:hypothetical protein E2320_000516 [Naja naja]|nr:hypothetical protein E2320_000516 [Naja naja]